MSKTSSKYSKKKAWSVIISCFFIGYVGARWLDINDVLEDINPVIWGALIAALVSSITVYFTAKANTNNLKLQLNYSSHDKEKEHIRTLRRESYHSVLKALTSMEEMMGNHALDTDQPKFAQTFQELREAFTRGIMTASDESANLLIDLRRRWNKSTESLMPAFNLLGQASTCLEAAIKYHNSLLYVEPPTLPDKLDQAKRAVEAGNRMLDDALAKYEIIREREIKPITLIKGKLILSFRRDLGVPPE